MPGLSGKNMRFDFGSGPTHFRITRGGITGRTQLVDRTNSESLGHEEFVFGVDGGDVDLDVIYTYSGPAVYSLIKNGTSGTATFYPDQGAAGATFAGTLMIETFQITGEVKGGVDAKITGKFTGGMTGTSV